MLSGNGLIGLLFILPSFRRKKKCIRVYEDGNFTDGEEDIGSDSVHDSDSMVGSPANSTASEDFFSTAHKARIRNVDSPLVQESSRDFAELDLTMKSHSDILPGHRSPFSTSKLEKMDTENFMTNIVPSHTSSPVSFSKTAGLSRSYSIESLAKSSIKPEGDMCDRTDKPFDNCLSPLSSPNDFPPPKFSISTFSEDLNRNLSPKKKPSGLNNSFSISSLSVSSVTPSRLSCS